MIYIREMPDGSQTMELLSVRVQIRDLDPSVREIRELNDQIGQISLSDQYTADPKSKRRRGRKSKPALAETSAAGQKRKRKVVVDEGPAKPAEFQRELFDLNEYPPEDEAATGHAKYAPENPEAPEPSGVKKQPNGKKAAVYHNSADSDFDSSDSDYDSSRTVSDLQAESMSLNRRRYEVVDKDTKTKSILKKNDVTDDTARIPLPKRRKVTFNLDEDYENSRKNTKIKKRTPVRRVHSPIPPEPRPTELTPSHDEMVIEVTCTGLGRCDAVGGCEPSGSESVVVRAGEVNGSGEIVQAREECVVNRNPAEFSPKTAETFFQ